MDSEVLWRGGGGRQLPDDPLRWLRLPRMALRSVRRRALLGRYRADVERLGRQFPVQHCTDSALRDRLGVLRPAVRRYLLTGAGERDGLLEALAVVQEIAERSLGQRPYAVQLMAALGMIDGHVVQLAPGEGKTLTIALAAIIQAWRGMPCHLMTANTYLAERDAGQMEPLYAFCGLECAALDDGGERARRREIYASSIVYGTAQQFLADFLRDRLALGTSPDRLSLALSQAFGARPDVVMRGLGCAIVDEADSTLVDEANTPLIISGPRPDPVLAEAVTCAHRLVSQLTPDSDYRIDRRHRDVRFSADGWRRLLTQRETMPAEWRTEARFEHILNQAALARSFYRRDEHYIVEDDAVVIIDERTGRPMPARSWSHGLHQAVECQAGIALSHPTETVERMSFQNFLRLYAHLSGASGTLQGLDAELGLVYDKLVVRIPTRKTDCRRIHPVEGARDALDKERRIVAEAARLHALGRPVLIGTRRIEDSERLHALLDQQGIQAALLNAKHPEAEAAIVANAGVAGQVTVATNMAGRGTDIAVPPEVTAAGGLVVILSEPHAAARVDWQLYGRTGRQGQPGEVRAYTSPEDALFVQHLPRMLQPLLRSAFLLPDRHRTIRGLIAWCQHRAQRRALRQRQALNRSDRHWRDAMSFSDRQ